MLKLVRKPTVIVPVSSVSYSRKGRYYTEDKKIEVKKNFDMPIPTHVHFYLTPQLILKMKNLKNVLKEYHLSELKFISSTIKEDQHSYVELYTEDEKLNSSFYNEDTKNLLTFEDKHFMIKLDKARNYSFQASFLYANEKTCFEFYTQFFELN